MSPIGYDMSTVLPMNPAEQAVHDEAAQAFHAAVKERDSLPEDAAGRLNTERVRNTPGLDYDSHEAYDGRTKEFIAAQNAVDAAYEKMNDTYRSYFRLNIWGMSRYITAMEALGMAFDAPAAGRPDWPDWSILPDDETDAVWDLAGKMRTDLARQGCGPDGTPGTSLAVQDTEPVRKELVDHVKAQLAVTLWTPDASKGLYLGKFSTNDDWWVTPAEIRAALDIYRQQSGTAVGGILKQAGITDSSYWMKWIGYLQYAETHGGFTVG